MSAHRVVDAVTFEVDDVRAMRSITPGSTVNDVVLAIVGGARREYLSDKDELPDLSLTAMCPISLRSETDRSRAARWAPQPDHPLDRTASPQFPFALLAVVRSNDLLRAGMTSCQQSQNAGKPAGKMRRAAALCDKLGRQSRSSSWDA